MLYKVISVSKFSIGDIMRFQDYPISRLVIRLASILEIGSEQFQYICAAVSTKVGLN